MRTITYTLLFFISLNAVLAQTNEYHTLYHTEKGVDRQYIVHLPPGYDTSQSLPLVFNLHGLGGNNSDHMDYSEFNNISDTGNFIVVHPQGLVATTSWGQTDELWDAYFAGNTLDLQFFDTLIDQMYYDYNIDLKRVYSTGHSNGGYMSYRLACELSERIAAVASVGGAMTFEQENNCNLSHSMPIMQIHGTADATVPWEGIEFFNDSIPALISYWKNINNCTSDSLFDSIPNTNLADSCTAFKEDYYMCDSVSNVVLITVENGGHSWPGAVDYPPLGYTCQDFHASSEIWNFFNKYSLENPVIPEPEPADPDTVSIISELSQEISIQPNPFTNNITVRFGKLSDKNIDFELINLLGESVIKKRLSSSTATINTNKLKPGVYFVVLTGVYFVVLNGKAVKKVLKSD